MDRISSVDRGKDCDILKAKNRGSREYIQGGVL
jgi:hypothetical protein